MTKLDERFIVNLQGKNFVTYEGLLDLAHQMKLKSIKTEIIQLPTTENNQRCIMKAIAITEEGKEFEGYGDADTANVNSMIAKHLIRMAETRAKARALRDLTNVGMTALEELGGEDGDNPSPKAEKPAQRTSNKSNGNLATDKQLGFLYKLVKDKNYGNDAIASYIKTAYNKNSSKELTKQEASEIIKMLNGIGA